MNARIPVTAMRIVNEVCDIGKEASLRCLQAIDIGTLSQFLHCNNGQEFNGMIRGLTKPKLKERIESMEKHVAKGNVSYECFMGQWFTNIFQHRSRIMSQTNLSIEDRTNLSYAVNRYVKAVERFEQASTEFNEACQALRGILGPSRELVAQVDFTHYLVQSDEHSACLKSTRSTLFDFVTRRHKFFIAFNEGYSMSSTSLVSLRTMWLTLAMSLVTLGGALPESWMCFSRSTFEDI